MVRFGNEQCVVLGCEPGTATEVRKVGDSDGQDATLGQLNTISELNTLNNSSKSVSSSDFWGRNQMTCSSRLSLCLIRGLSQI